MPLTAKQTEYLQNCSHRWNVKTGATGSGKSFVDYTVVIPKRLLAARGEGLLVLLGNTKGTLERNILDPMREVWGPELVGNISSDNTVKLFGKKVYALGADNKKHVARIQGATFEYVYGDEVTTWSEDVFSMLKSRMRCKHSCFDGTCNPDGPQHWFKKFLDSDADIFQQSYTIDDGALPSDVVAELKKEYSGTVYYNRFILGQWMAAEGVIYRLFADSPAQFLWPEEKPLKLQKVQIGVDFGGNGSQHAFVATGTLPGYAGVVGLMSRRMDAKDTDEAALSRAFLEFAEAVFLNWGEIHAVYCDSAEQVLKNSLRSAALRSRFAWLADRIYNSQKIEITDRIRLTSILIGGGRFWYLPTALTLRDALSAALWSGKHPGKDERLDDGTTDIDTLDGFEYTIERDYKRYLRLTT